jgi:hypothetical protein
MTKITIVYTDGHEEHYNVIPPAHLEDTNLLKRFKDIIEDDMLKLVIEDSQIVLIPMANIRKIISQADDITPIKMKEFPGFMNAKIAD